MLDVCPPQGSIFLLVGGIGGGKSTVAARLAANFQKLDGREVGWVDAEYSLDSEWLASCGVDLSRLSAYYVDEPLDAVKDLTQMCEAFGLVVVDSLAALHIQLQGGMAERARLFNEFFRQVVGVLRRNKSILVVIQHFVASLQPPYRAIVGGCEQQYQATRIVELQRRRMRDGATAHEGLPKAMGNAHTRPRRLAKLWAQRW